MRAIVHGVTIAFRLRRAVVPRFLCCVTDAFDFTSTRGPRTLAVLAVSRCTPRLVWRSVTSGKHVHAHTKSCEGEVEMGSVGGRWM